MYLMRRTGIFFIVLLTTFILFPGVIFASTTDINVVKEGDTATIEIPDKGDYYKVLSYDEVVYEGESNRPVIFLNEKLENIQVNVYQDDNLIDNYFLKIKNDTELKDKGEFLDSLQILSTSNVFNDANQADPKEVEMKQSVKSDVLEVIYSINEVTFSWSELPSDYPYEIYRDGELIATTTESLFTDSDVESGVIYHYEVLSKTDMSPEYEKELRESFEESNISEEELDELTKIQGSLNTIVQTPSNLVESFSNLPGSPEWRNYVIRYTTFIPDFSLKNPTSIVSPHKYFKGDNRSFDFWSDRYRTRADVELIMTDGNSMSITRSVGLTTGCEDSACTRITETGRASTNGIKFNTGTNTRSKKVWDVGIDVGIPFNRLYPNINGYYQGEMTSSPSLYLNGAHDRAPSHEIYIVPTFSGDVMPLYRRASDSSFWLIPGAPQTHFTVSY